MKILFLYPNHKGMNMLPPAIGLLSSCLKRHSHVVQIFDTTNYESVEIGGKKDSSDSDGSKSDRLMAKPYTMPKEVVLKSTDVYEDFKIKVNKFRPDLIALSCTEDMFHLGISLLKSLNKNILTIAGGVFPTFAPKLVLDYKEIDIVCKGEGENALTELCNRIDNGQDYSDIPNLWMKKNDIIVSNPTKMVDMNRNPLIDMSLFEEARFYRPMGGKVYRMFPVETHRGCPYKCAFCNSPSQMTLYRKEVNTNYLRRKSFENMRQELIFYKEEMKAEYLYFWADTFFSWKQTEFDTFCEIYEEIKLPFWCQTRPETVNLKKFQKLKNIGCARISFGVEHGNPSFRKTYLNRLMTNNIITEGLRTVKKIGIPFSVNNIIGFPHETRELAFDTIELNRTFEADDRNAYAFTPFSGTPLRDLTNKLGFTKETDIVKSMVAHGSILDMPQFTRDEVNKLIKTFNFYVKFPKSKWKTIRKAEEDTEEGRRIYKELKEEFILKFWKKDISFEKSAAENDPHSSI